MQTTGAKKCTRISKDILVTSSIFQTFLFFGPFCFLGRWLCRVKLVARGPVKKRFKRMKSNNRIAQAYSQCASGTFRTASDSDARAA